MFPRRNVKEKTRIAAQHASVIDRIAMHVFSSAHVTASKLEHPASQWGNLSSPGIAARSEPSNNKRVETMYVFAYREKAGVQCVFFPLIEFSASFADLSQ